MSDNRQTRNDDNAQQPDGTQCMIYVSSGKVRGSAEKIVVKGTINRRNQYLKPCKIDPPKFCCVTLRTLYVTFTDSGWSFDPVPVDVPTVKGTLRNPGGILAKNTSQTRLVCW